MACRGTSGAIHCLPYLAGANTVAQPYISRSALVKATMSHGIMLSSRGIFSGPQRRDSPRIGHSRHAPECAPVPNRPFFARVGARTHVRARARAASLKIMFIVSWTAALSRDFCATIFDETLALRRKPIIISYYQSGKLSSEPAAMESTQRLLVCG